MRVCFVCFVHFLCDLQPYFSCNLPSYNPTSHKATTLTRRVQLVCDSPNSLHDETDYLNNVSSKNNYKADFVRRNTHSNTDSNTQRLHRTSEATLKLSHVYYNFTIYVVRTNLQALYDDYLLMSRTKTNRKIDREQYTRSNAATARLLTLVKPAETFRRLTEHKPATRMVTSTIHIAEHHLHTKQQIDWDSVTCDIRDPLTRLKSFKARI